MAKPKNVYLVAQYAMKPRNPSQTLHKGYMKNGDNIRWDERVDVIVGIKDRDLVQNQIVLNITEQKTLKNSFNNDKTFMELFQYFYTSSPHEIAQALKATGISVTEHKEATDEPVQENVSDQVEEAIHGATEADSPGPGETTKKRRTKRSSKSESVATTATGDRDAEAQAEPSDVSH